VGPGERLAGDFGRPVCDGEGRKEEEDGALQVGTAGQRERGEEREVVSG
jgi:hypothetical protein